MKPAGFLLDAHIPGAVAHGVNASRPECRIEHLARWLGGRYRESADEVVLQAAFEAGLVFVTMTSELFRRFSIAGRLKERQFQPSR